MTHGLVIGKFYPPHVGHLALIQAALKKCERVTVMICHHPDQAIHGELRAKWLKESEPKAEYQVIDDCVPDDDSKGWAEYTIALLGKAPDIFFSSEDYGPVYAGFMQSEHVMVDRNRVKVSMSATAIRENPAANWDALLPGAKGFFAKRICVIGAESTGTTTLARELAEHYQTVWVPEYGRTYSEGRLRASNKVPWATPEFLHIARTQNEAEDCMAKLANKLLICDTNSFATELWHERYVGSMSEAVGRISQSNDADLYLLTDVSIPFVQDGLRDGEHVRAGMHERFAEELRRRGKAWKLVRGTPRERLDAAIQHCDVILKSLVWPKHDAYINK